METDDGVLDPCLLESRFFKGVAKASNIYRFPAEAGVLLCLRDTSCRDFWGVACIGGATPSLPTSLLEGEVPSWRRSNNPRTCPSFCGVGPREVFFNGVNRFRTTEGESYGSTSHGFMTPREGVCIICRFEELVSLPSYFRFRGVWWIGSGLGVGILPERISLNLLYSLYFAAP